ncbi:MAG: hypothetical protein IT431_03840 [Phycisphaerales bacterium]|nr:hypothetical protein [Phycisphaerales bacterium]
MMRMLVVLAVAVLSCPASAQSDTAFTYQGELLQGSMPADGSFPMTFRLWDAPSGGSPVGPQVSRPAVAVDEGRFAVELDFGASPFDNSPRWLEISVDGFTLAPRHPITRSPYAVQTRGIFVDDDENIGVGTTSPTQRVHVVGDGPAVRVTGTGDQPTSSGKLQLQGGNFPSQFSPLGAVEFYDETGGLRALVGGNKSGPSAAQLSFSVTPGEVAQVNIASNRVRVRDRIELVRGTDLGLAARLFGDGSDSFLQALGGNLAIGHESPVAPLDLAGNAYFRDRVGIGTSFPFATLDVDGNAFFRQRVGVGLSTPSATLDVLGDSTFRNRLRIGTTTPSLYGQLTIDDSGDGSIFAISAYSQQPAFPTIYADNAANGPVLWAISSGDVGPGGGGTIVVGDTAGANVAMDNNEIMARNNGSTAPLYLNADGGDVSMGLHRIHPALAYASITGGGNIVSRSSNVTGVQRLGPGWYEITIAGGITGADIVLCSGRYGGLTATGNTDTAPKLQVQVYDPFAEDFRDWPFTFVVYRP